MQPGRARSGVSSSMARPVRSSMERSKVSGLVRTASIFPIRRYDLDGRRLATIRRLRKLQCATDNRVRVMTSRLVKLDQPPRKSARKANVSPLWPKGQKWVMVVDGQESPEYEYVSPPVFSADGRRLAYGMARNGKYSVVVDAKAERNMMASRLICNSAPTASGSLTEPGRRTRWSRVTSDRKALQLSMGRKVRRTTSCGNWPSAPTASGWLIGRRKNG